MHLNPILATSYILVLTVSLFVSPCFSSDHLVPNTYLEGIQKHLRAAWRPSKRTLLCVTKVNAKLNKQGQVTATEFVSVGSKKEKEIIEQLSKSTGFDVLPEGFVELDVCLKFVSDSGFETVEVIQHTEQLHIEQLPLRTRAKLTADEESKYLDIVRRRLKRCWLPLGRHLSRLVVIDFAIKQNGSVSDIVIHESSGNAGYDQSGVDAILNAAPFPKFSEIPTDEIHIRFTFTSQFSDDTARFT